MSNDERMLTAFERAVLERLLRGDHPFLASLRAQLNSCEVSSREFTGVGFFTNIEVGASVAPASTRRRRIHVTGVGAKVKGLERGAGFMLYVEDGFLNFLEGFSYDEPWPPGDSEFSLIDELQRFDDPGVEDELADNS